MGYTEAKGPVRRSGLLFWEQNEMNNHYNSEGKGTRSRLDKGSGSSRRGSRGGTGMELLHESVVTVVHSFCIRHMPGVNLKELRL